MLLTGYLGSGKTTLLNRILKNEKGIKFAVIVNDIGEVNIDASLIENGGVVGQKDDSLVALQNDTGNRHSPTVIAAAITSQTGKARLPTHIELAGASCGLTRDSVILLEQIRTIDKSRLRERMGKLPDAVMDRVNGAIAVSFGLGGGRPGGTMPQ